MTNEMIAQYIGKECMIYAGSYGVNVTGKIVSVNENWIELELKKGNTQLVNADYIQSIKILDN